MDIIRKIEVFGDSIFKGIQLNSENLRYHVNNNIDFEMLSQKFSLSFKNHSKFGCTIQKGKLMIDAFLEKNPDCNAIIMDFGGNDCDFNWNEISERPNDNHIPNTPIDVFIETYKGIIEKLKQNGIEPILATLPPLEPQLFFDWFSKGLNKDNILAWLGNISTIYRHQETYSMAVMKVAFETGTRLIDLREPFLKHRRIEQLLCEDGTHPNTEGQKLITGAFSKFAEAW